MTIFRELLSIKDFRESRAELAVRKQRGILAEAIAARDAAEKQLNEFREYALRHERELYADLCRRIVRLRDLENAQLEVVDLRGRERSHEDTLSQSDHARNAEQQRLENAKHNHHEASKMKQKFVELAQIYSDENLKELERKEDAEMEEVAELRRERDDWDESHEEAA
jgi:type III secretion protein O